MLHFERYVSSRLFSFNRLASCSLFETLSIHLYHHTGFVLWEKVLQSSVLRSYVCTNMDFVNTKSVEKYLRSTLKWNFVHDMMCVLSSQNIEQCGSVFINSNAF